MGIDRGTLEALRHLVKPLAMRVANSVARGVVQLINDGKKLQLLQVGVLAGEDGDDAEHHQSYGFSSVPLAGAEAVLVYPNGDRSHPLAIAVSDRRYRPAGGAPGEVTVYNNAGAKVTLRANGDIELQPGPLGKVIAAGANPVTEGVVVGTGIDPFTGLTYTALGNASIKVFAKK